MISHLLDEENGLEVIEKKCGETERPKLDYKEGCETRRIPFKSKECYCKTSYCNAAPQLSLQLSLLSIVVLVTVSVVF